MTDSPARDLLEAALRRLPAPPASIDAGDLGSYRWGEFMLSAAQAVAMLDETSTWDDLRERFRAVADEPEYHLDPARVDFLRLLPVEPTTVLDVGCGLGLSSEEIARAGHAVVGVDRSRFRAAFTRARLERQGLTGTAVVGDLNTFTGPRELFGAVVLLGVFEWLGHGKDREVDAEQQAGLDLVAGLVSDGGRVLLVIENRFGWPFLAGRPEVHVHRRWVGVAPRWATRSPRLWRLDEPFSVYTHSLSRLRQMAGRSGLDVRTVFGTLPQYHRPSTYVPLVWDGAYVDRAAVAAGYEAFAERHEQRRSARILAGVHRYLPTPVAANIAPGFVIELTKGSSSPPSTLDRHAARPVVLHIGGNGPDGTTTLTTPGPAPRSVIKLPRRVPNRWEEIVATTDTARSAAPDLVVPVHRAVDGAVLIDHLEGTVVDTEGFVASLRSLARLHEATMNDRDRPLSGLRMPSGDMGPLEAAPPGTYRPCLTHGDWIPRNLRRSAGALSVIDWEYCDAAGSGWVDALWAVGRTWRIPPDALARYAGERTVPLRRAELEVATRLAERRLPVTEATRAAERMAAAVESLAASIRD